MKTWDIRNLWVDTVAAYNGGTKARYWSIGYWTDEEHCEDTWREVEQRNDYCEAEFRLGELSD